MTVAENIFTEKYGLTRTHSEVLYSAKIVKPGNTLDLGCGNGRNSLWLAANGYDVTAWDKNPMSIDTIERIKAAEGIENLQTAIKDLNRIITVREQMLYWSYLMEPGHPKPSQQRRLSVPGRVQRAAEPLLYPDGRNHQ